jgi:phosphomannomutase
LGIEIVAVYCTTDPLFSQRPSDPKPENLSKLVDTVKNNKCDFGVAFDGDGDRSIIVDDKGSILSADQTGIIIGKYGLEHRTGTIIANVECSKSVAEQLEPLGFKLKQIEVGHTFLTLHAKKEKALLGIESSGHLILPKYFLFDDALVIPLKIAEILEKTNKSLSTITKEIPIYPIKKIEIPCEENIKFDVIDQLKEQLEQEYDQLNTLDGIRVNLQTGWVLIRASNTSPLIRLTTEADTEQTVQLLAGQFKEKVDQVINNQ